MLKRRIFAASLASVLALSSFSVSAFADDEIKSQTVTKAELQKYVDSFEKFREDDIFEYGTVQGEYFQDAIDYAENVLANNKATAEDFTAAYQMLKAVRDGMKQYNKDELAGKLDEYKGIYDTENVLNEVLGDTIYDEDSWSDFESAYDEALSYVDSNDGRLISDAYLQLVEAKNNLKELDTVTKAEFRAVLKQYEAIIAGETSYESWRRGTCSVAPTTGNKKDENGDKILSKVTKAKYITFGNLLEIVKGKSQIAIPDDKGKAEAVQSTTATQTWIKVIGSGTVEEGINKQYARFDEIASSKVTSDEDIVNAYKAAKDAVAVFNGWTEDNTKRAAKADVEKLIKEYHNDFVAAAMLTEAQKLVHDIDSDAVYDAESKTMKATASTTIKVDDDGFISVKETLAYDKDTGKDKKITKGTDLLQFVPVELADLTAFGKAIENAPESVDEAGEAEEGAKTNADKKFDASTMKAFLDVYMELCVVGANCANETNEYNGNEEADNPISSGCKKSKDFKDLWEAYDEFLNRWYRIVDENVFNSSDCLKKVNSDSEDLTDVEGLFLSYTAQDVLDLEREFEEFKDAWNDYIDTDCGGKHANDKVMSGKFTKADAKITADKESGSTTEKLAEAEKNVVLAGIKESTKIENAADLEKAATVAEKYLTAETIDKSDGEKSLLDAIGEIDENDTVSKATGSVAEWTLIKRNLQYALEDLFPKNDSKTYTKSNVKDLIEKAYDLAEKTGDASKFQENHVALVEARKAAIEWLAAANKTKNYKEGDAVSYKAEYGVEVAGTEVSLTATETYKALEGKYNNLDKELQDYAISYGEIRDLIVEVAEYLDKNDSEALKTAMTDVAYKLSTLDADGEDIDDNEVFDDSREFQEFNRLHTDNKNSDKPTDAEKDLKTAYEALQTAYDALTSPTTTKGDVPQIARKMPRSKGGI